MDIAAIEGRRSEGGTKKYFAFITLNLKNDINSANWSQIFNAMTEMEIPEYIRGMIASYFSDRILYETAAERKTYKIRGRVPQGSVLGPDLWNIIYNA